MLTSGPNTLSFDASLDIEKDMIEIRTGPRRPSIGATPGKETRLHSLISRSSSHESTLLPRKSSRRALSF
jgi:hypothetical protein